jgi:hypothetical protein
MKRDEILVWVRWGEENHERHERGTKEDFLNYNGSAADMAGGKYTEGKWRVNFRPDAAVVGSISLTVEGLLFRVGANG